MHPACMRSHGGTAQLGSTAMVRELVRYVLSAAPEPPPPAAVALTTVLTACQPVGKRSQSVSQSGKGAAQRSGRQRCKAAAPLPAAPVRNGGRSKRHLPRLTAWRAPAPCQHSTGRICVCVCTHRAAGMCIHKRLFLCGCAYYPSALRCIVGLQLRVGVGTHPRQSTAVSTSCSAPSRGRRASPCHCQRWRG